MAQFSLSWNDYKNNICNGLSSLQQEEEFVDMTLAADGHLVKAHQMVISLASPYLKELIKSAPCAHPVIFLNKISYPILCSILEYIYSGEAVVNKDNLHELIEAGKALHIKGLADMQSLHHDIVKPNNRGYEESNVKIKLAQNNTSCPVDILDTYKSRRSKDYSETPHHSIVIDSINSNSRYDMKEDVKDPFTNIGDDTLHSDHVSIDSDNDSINNDKDSKRKKKTSKSSRNVSLPPSIRSSVVAETGDGTGSRTLQYALSNQGAIQLVLNRFVYCLRYVYRKSTPTMRQWRCVDYNGLRCPALVTTRDDCVVQRFAAHKHPFHDRRIMKKMQSGLIFSALNDAETHERFQRVNATKNTGDTGNSDKSVGENCKE